MMKRFIITLMVIVCLSLIFRALSLADIIYLKSGHKEEGEIIEENKDYIIIFDPKSLWRIVIYKRHIDKIEKETVTIQEESKEAEKSKTDAKNKLKDDTKEKRSGSIFNFIFNWFKRKR